MHKWDTITRIVTGPVVGLWNIKIPRTDFAQPIRPSFISEIAIDGDCVYANIPVIREQTKERYISSLRRAQDRTSTVSGPFVGPVPQSNPKNIKKTAYSLVY